MFATALAGVLLPLAALACSYASATASAPSPSAPTGGMNTAATLEQAVSMARTDAAARFGVDAQALQLISASRVTWRDGSLGCPQPDRVYTQALVPGYRIRLALPTQTLDYHASARGALVLCPKARALEPLPNSQD
jgi:hypothetical protein